MCHGSWFDVKNFILQRLTATEIKLSLSRLCMGWMLYVRSNFNAKSHNQSALPPTLSSSPHPTQFSHLALFCHSIQSHEDFTDSAIRLDEITQWALNLCWVFHFLAEPSKTSSRPFLLPFSRRRLLILSNFRLTRWTETWFWLICFGEAALPLLSYRCDVDVIIAIKL